MKTCLPLACVVALFLAACSAADPASRVEADASATPDANASSDAEADANNIGDAGSVAKGNAGSTSPSDDASTGPAPSLDCEAHIEVDQLKPATCAVVDPVSHRVGHLQWVCAGGPAQVYTDCSATAGVTLHP